MKPKRTFFLLSHRESSNCVNKMFAEYTVCVGVYCIVYEEHKTLLKLLSYVDKFSAGQSLS